LREPLATIKFKVKPRRVEPVNRFIRHVTMANMVLIGLCVGCDSWPWGSSLPVYSFDQTDSSHAGYRRTTITSAGTVFVHDYEEYSLQLANFDPKQVVGRSKFGSGKICAIEGQSPTAYLAADMGSEMPAYEVFRGEQQPPFDWGQATFQRMQLAMPEGPAANKVTTDPAVIQDVVLTLRDGTPAAPFTVESEVPTSTVHSLLLGSDQLPGLVFTPQVYFDPSGQVYLAENLSAVEYKGTHQSIRASWIPASASFTQWSKTGD
jgi:hypothetical protein